VTTLLPSAREVDIAPNQRFALGGKTRSGKTRMAMLLASILVPLGQSDWECWWIDTKNDPKDIAAVREWGFEVPRKDIGGLWKRKSSPHKLFIVRDNQYEVTQDIFYRAYNQRGVLVVVDEYVQVIKSQQQAGPALLDIFQRGGGLDVGIIGLTQEPVYIPRQLFSQATHQMLFAVSYPYDVAYFQGLYEDYENPIRKGDPKGFYHIAVDLDGQGAYYSHQREWFDKVVQGERKSGWA
jgi:hypothetical protein